MNVLTCILTCAALFIGRTVYAQQADKQTYPFDPAVQVQKDRTPGEIIQREFSGSGIYPGTQRPYWIYIPAAYRPDKPACLFVCMDGIQFNTPTVFDNLIATGEMPVTIGVFVGSGTVVDADKEPIRFNRSNEFDKTDDTFVRFLLEDLLPDVEKQTTSDGRAIRLSAHANDRAIAGCSSGAICAFTAAWERPDAFSRVFSAIGTYVPMRGGNEYPALIRKTEPKPIRIFLQDGSQDTWNPLFGSWYESNLLMESALRFAGYEVAHDWGHGGHDGIHATKIFPDVVRWLWKGWPHPVQKGISSNDLLSHILQKDQQWERVEVPFTPVGTLYANENGAILLQDDKGTVSQLGPEGSQTKVTTLSSSEYLLGSAKDGFYLADAKGTVYSLKNGKKEVVARGLRRARSVLDTGNGNLYIMQQEEDEIGKLWLVTADGGREAIYKQPYGGDQLAIYPNHKMLICTEKHSQWLNSFTFAPDGILENEQRYYWLHNTDNYDWDEQGNMLFDRNGNLYIATAMGIQVCDQNGRVRAILTLPSGKISSLCFGGENMDILYVLSEGKLYSRKMNIQGIYPWMPAMNPGSQGAG